jgi:hypothetical protein
MSDQLVAAISGLLRHVYRQIVIVPLKERKISLFSFRQVKFPSLKDRKIFLFSFREFRANFPLLKTAKFPLFSFREFRANFPLLKTAKFPSSVSESLVQIFLFERPQNFPLQFQTVRANFPL